MTETQRESQRHRGRDRDTEGETEGMTERETDRDKGQGRKKKKEKQERDCPQHYQLEHVWVPTDCEVWLEKRRKKSKEETAHNTISWSTRGCRLTVKCG